MYHLMLSQYGNTEIFQFMIFVSLMKTTGNGSCTRDPPKLDTDAVNHFEALAYAGPRGHKHPLMANQQENPDALNSDSGIQNECSYCTCGCVLSQPRQNVALTCLMPSFVPPGML